MRNSEYNTVSIYIEYDTADDRYLRKKYTTGYNPDTGIQQYLDYYEQGFRHDYPNAVKMEIVRMEIFNNENENHV